MKNILLLFIGFFISNATFAQGYDITVKIRGLDCSGELILANHYGGKQYSRDTSSSCTDGVFHFTGKERLESGVYLVVTPDRNYFEIIVSNKEDQTKYYFENDANLKPENAVVKGSKENIAFFEFNRFAAQKGKEADALVDSMNNAKDESTKKSYKDQLNAIGEEVAKKRREMTEANPGLFLARLYVAMREVSIPETPSTVPESDVQTWRYIYARNHYWDNIDFSEDGLVRSPVFHTKLKEFYDNFVPPIPDTAIAITDHLIKQIEAAGSKEQFKYTVHYLLRHFQELKYMCFDKATYYIANTYYCSGKAFWTDSSFRAEMCEQCRDMAPTLCGQVAPNITMPDSSFARRISLYDVKSPVTIVVFWDHECGHCKKEIPVIQSFYDSCNKSEVFIYAVYTQGDWEGWKTYIHDKELTFLNVANAFGEDQFRKHYNIVSTPQIYVLDENKVIVFKKVGAKDLPAIVQHMLEIQGYKESDGKMELEPSDIIEQEYEEH